MKKNKNWFFILLLSLAALSLAGTAAYFSVFGLSKLFAAAGLGITILAASLEFAKLVTVSYVYRFWKTIKKSLRGFYVFAVVFIMLLTSIGIYGFLTGAYQQSANKVQLRDSQIQIAQNKKTLFVNQLDRLNKSIESSSNRINTISGLRNQQEQRLDKLYNQKSLGGARRTESQITGSDQQINNLNSDISNLMKQTNVINDSIAFYDQKIAELNASDVSTEVGPYKFVAQLTGIPIDNLVNIVAILIVLVFDPLAVTLLIGVNQLIMIGKKDEGDEENDVDDSDTKSGVVDSTTTTTEPTTTTTTTEPTTTTTTTEPTTTTTTTEPTTTTTTTTYLIEDLTSTETTTEMIMNEIVENMFNSIGSDSEIAIVTDDNEHLVDVIKTSAEDNINDFRMEPLRQSQIPTENNDIQQVASISGKINSSYFVSDR